MDKEQIEERWNDLLNYIANNPKEFATYPKNNSQPRWFKATANIQKNYIAITNAEEHSPSCKIKFANERKLIFKDFKNIYPLYIRRELGERVSKELNAATVNSSYFLSLLYNFFKEKNITC